MTFSKQNQWLCDFLSDTWCFSDVFFFLTEQSIGDSIHLIPMDSCHLTLVLLARTGQTDGVNLICHPKFLRGHKNQPLSQKSFRNRSQRNVFDDDWCFELTWIALNDGYDFTRKRAPGKVVTDI